MRTLRTILPYMTALFLIAAVYTGWVVFSRWNAKREGERAAKEQEAREAKQVIDRLGGGKLKILSFWARPAVAKRGARVLVCYGVVSAKTVRIDPHIDDITPSLSRCLEAFPKHTTEYKITAEDGEGHTATGSITVRVE